MTWLRKAAEEESPLAAPAMCSQAAKDTSYLHDVILLRLIDEKRPGFSLNLRKKSASMSIQIAEGREGAVAAPPGPEARTAWPPVEEVTLLARILRGEVVEM